VPPETTASGPPGSLADPVAGELIAPTPRRADLLWSLLAAATVSVTLVLLTVANHRYFFYGDTSAAYYGWWYHLGDLVRHGQWPMIDPHAWRAGNFAAEGQWALWSPLVIAIGLVASVAPQVVLTGTVVKMLLALVAALGVFRLTRSYDVPPPAAYVAAVLAPMGGMTQFLDLTSWAAGEMIWALLPWTWWALRRTMLRGANPLPALALGYLLVTVGYVFGTIMLVVALVACVLDCLLKRDRAALLRVVAAGVLLGLVAFTVYLPGVLTESVVARNTGFEELFQGKFTTDPLALFASVLPTSAVHGTTDYVLPYAYLAWLLPAAAWLDWRRLRQEWRPLAGLLVFTVVTFLMVDGPGHVGPLRWPLRLQPFLVTALVVLLVVLWRRLGVQITWRRLAFSLLWVLLAGVLAFVRAPTQRAGHLASVLLVGGSLAVVWWLFDRGRLTWVAPAIGVLTVVAFVLQHAVYDHLPLPQRNAPNEVSTYQSVLPGAVGDVLQVGKSDDLVQSSPEAAQTLPIGSLWYLTGHPVQNTYTVISHKRYKRLFCTYYQGNSCPELLGTLFSTQGRTGMTRVDLLGVSSLLLIRRDLPPWRVAHPPPGWQITSHTPYAVLWTRTTPVPGAGSVAWASPGTSVSDVQAGQSATSFRVDAVPPGGGTVVLRLLSWPGYSTSVGSLTYPVDGYLVTVQLPASAAGQTVRVSFHPPGWNAEVAAWVIALLAGAAWSVAHEIRRRRGRTVRS
jgi:hypothetical protein